MIGYNVKIQEFHNGEVKFSIYPEGINYVPDEFKSYIENERIERKLQESQDGYIYNPFTEMVEKQLLLIGYSALLYIESFPALRPQFLLLF